MAILDKDQISPILEEVSWILNIDFKQGNIGSNIIVKQILKTTSLIGEMCVTLFRLRIQANNDKDMYGLS